MSSRHSSTYCPVRFSCCWFPAFKRAETDENPDISIAVIKLLEELTDEDVGEGAEDQDAFLQALDGLLVSLVRFSPHL
jgi:hypothetical protein